MRANREDVSWETELYRAGTLGNGGEAVVRANWAAAAPASHESNVDARIKTYQGFRESVLRSAKHSTSVVVPRAGLDGCTLVQEHFRPMFSHRDEIVYEIQFKTRRVRVENPPDVHRPQRARNKFIVQPAGTWLLVERAAGALHVPRFFRDSAPADDRSTEEIYPAPFSFTWIWSRPLLGSKYGSCDLDCEQIPGFNTSSAYRTLDEHSPSPMPRPRLCALMAAQILASDAKLPVQTFAPPGTTHTEMSPPNLNSIFRLNYVLKSFIHVPRQLRRFHLGVQQRSVAAPRNLCGACKKGLGQAVQSRVGKSLPPSAVIIRLPEKFAAYALQFRQGRLTEDALSNGPEAYFGPGILV
ncbi:hypothetical protein B0H17DRAFT_1130775 [Mycena rosella]|uniref:Uncharacterized protein n=1 Tax=Mycena rosella TaxID=1033263 RepID=A0AAD7GLM7_MYCRO|nr:hypothetical protein B0H17DRAFT_1130775 [Mycena rosella]